MTRTVIVGAGIAGAQTALELRHRGYAGQITLIGAESGEPYDRPPLSKEFLKGSVERDTLSLLTAQTARERAITMRLGCRVTGIQPSEREVVLSDDSTVGYEYLVLATGAHNRPLPVPGAHLPGVWSLRQLEEAEGLRDALDVAAEVVIVGGGFIGLEVAAAARTLGARVTVVEFLPRVMARVLSPQMSRHFADVHCSHGVQVLTGVGVTEVAAGSTGTASSVTLSDGTVLPADVVVVGIGVLPSTELAAGAGLHISDGIVVNQRLRTSDRHIFAVGDCARFPCAVSGRELRLESIQNAADQARFVAGQIASMSQPPGDEPSVSQPEISCYAALPWFWSEQYDSKLQIAGVAPTDADSVVRGDPTTGSFSVCRFVDERLVAVESVNHPKDHLGARKLLAADPRHLKRVTRTSVADPSTALKELLDA